MGEPIDTLAQFVAETPWAEIPAAVQQHAKLVLLDTLGVILAGAEQPEVQQLRERLRATAGTGATVLARWLAHLRPAHCRPPERHCWPLDRSLRRPSLCRLSGSSASRAWGGGGGRVDAAQRA